MNQHPRFYYVILPAVFVLQAAGAILIWDAGRRRLRPQVRAVSDTSV